MSTKEVVQAVAIATLKIKLHEAREENEKLLAGIKRIAEERDEFMGSTFEYMAGYRSGQEYLQAQLRELLKP